MGTIGPCSSFHRESSGADLSEALKFRPPPIKTVLALVTSMEILGKEGREG
jgi:hypothetical protein